MTTLQKTHFQGARTGLFKKIVRLREAQAVYMPLLARTHDISLTDRQRMPETIPLYLPSEIPAEERCGCLGGIVDLEDRMRFAEAHDSLDELRRLLRTRTILNTSKIKHVTGQVPNTRARDVQRRFDIRVQACKERYRHARAKTLSLRGEGSWTSILRELKDEDIRALNERERTREETAERNRLAELAKFRPPASACAANNNDEDLDGEPYGVLLERVITIGESRRTLSWIWYGSGGCDGSDNEQMAEGMSIIQVRRSLAQNFGKLSST